MTCPDFGLANTRLNVKQADFLRDSHLPGLCSHIGLHLRGLPIHIRGLEDTSSSRLSRGGVRYASKRGADEPMWNKALLKQKETLISTFFSSFIAWATWAQLRGCEYSLHSVALGPQKQVGCNNCNNTASHHCQYFLQKFYCSRYFMEFLKFQTLFYNSDTLYICRRSSVEVVLGVFFFSLLGKTRK